MRSVSTSEMRLLERVAIDQRGIPVHVLMDHAGKAVAEAVRSLLSGRKRVIALCGGGHNGADGVVAARWLRGWGMAAEVWWLKDPAEAKGSAALHMSIARHFGVRFKSFAAIPDRRRVAELRKADVLIDALLGTGTEPPLRPAYLAAIASLNAARRPIVAVDLPSGLDADRGQPLEATVKATVTVTMGLPKKGLLKPAAKRFVGRLLIADIGLPK